jgi:N6-adenosine-specific RNA methylase IME4
MKNNYEGAKNICDGAYQYNLEVNEFYNLFDKESVDVIITDPPYPMKIGGDSKWMNSANFTGGATKDKIDFYETMTEEKLKDFIFKSYDLLKNDRPFFIMTNESNLNNTIEYAEEAGFVLKNKIIWVKCRDFYDGIAMGRYFLNGYEYMLLFVKGAIKPINDRMNVFVHPPITRGLNAKPKELYAHCLGWIKDSEWIIVDPFGGSDPLTRAKMHRLIKNTTISNVFITTAGNDPAKWGVELRSTLFNFGGGLE